MDEPEFLKNMAPWVKRLQELQDKRDLEWARLLADPNAVVRVQDDAIVRVRDANPPAS